MSVVAQAVVGDPLWEARAAAFAPGEFVGQESFVTAGEVLGLARRAGVARGVRLLDLCCGIAGPGLHLVRELGCGYVGVDSSTAAIDRARQRAAEAGLRARFVVAGIPPLPDPGSVGSTPFDVVLLLETMLAFRDKVPLLQSISAVLPVGGRFACTLEVGEPLTAAERDSMPGSDTVWPSRLPRFRAELGHAGLRVRWGRETTRAHRATVDALLASYTAAEGALVGTVGAGAVDHLVTSHRLWSRWLGSGRVRTFALVAEKARPR